MTGTDTITLTGGPAIWETPDAIPKATAQSISALKGVPFLFRTMMRLATNLKRGRLIAILPDDQAIRIEGSEPGETGVMIVRDYAMARYVLRGGNTGFGEAYIDGVWDSPDLPSLMTMMSQNVDFIRNLFTAKPVTRFLSQIMHFMRRNSKKQARKNIEAHYDLGNSFYSSWLDETMTYSSALYERPDQDLSEAQRNKYAALAKRIDLQPDHHVLEIGCGWGGFAEYAAGEIGCRVTGVTISQEQYDFARARMERQGLSDRVSIEYRDYRDIDGKFDRIASIEMFEAVGEAYWPRYFQAVHDLLKDGGKAGLQIITIRDDYFPFYRRGVDFIQRYIFPGGMLPSPSVFAEHVSQAGLKLTDTRTFGIDYARTLAQWNRRFQKVWPQISSSGQFDERFRRLWTFYLAYCEGGFRSGSIDVAQVRLERG